MTPEQKAIAKERGAKAMKEMKDCGFPGKKTMVVIKRLLRSLDFDWELIEAENYSILVDAIISFDESEEHRPSKTRADDDEEDADCNGQIVNGEVPLLRKRPASNPEEQPLTGDFIVKMPKLEVDCTPDRDFQESGHGGFARNPRGSNDAVSPDASSRLGQSGQVNSLANAKGKGILVDASHGQSGLISRARQRDKTPVVGIRIDTPHGQLVPVSPRADRRDKSNIVERSQPMVIFKEPKLEPGVEPIPEKGAVNADTGHTANVRPDSHPPMFDVPIVNAPFHCNTSKNEDSHRKNYSVEDGCLSLEKSGCSSQENISQTSSHPCTSEEKSGKGVVLPNSSTAEVELASSADGKVKFLLSWEEANVDHEMPTLDSILNLAEARCLNSEDVQAGFSLKGILQETCEMVLKLSKSSKSGVGSLADKAPNLAPRKRPRTENSSQGLCASSSFVPDSSEGDVRALVSLNVEANIEVVTSDSMGPET